MTIIMKSNFKKATLLLTGIMVGGKLLAQTPDSTSANPNYVQPFSSGNLRTFSIGFEGGLLSPYTMFGPNKQDFKSPHEQIGYGGFIKEQLLPSFGLQADFMRGKEEGAVTADDQTNGTYTSFSTKIHYSVDLVGNFTLANINWGSKQSFMQPYLTAGAGLINYTAAVTNGGGTTIGSRSHDMYIPVGVGFKINLAKGVNLDLGYQVNFVNA